VEQYARDFGRRRRDVELTVLRFANFLGPDIETALTRYFSLPVIPTPAGYDPRIQLVHEDDALEVLARAVREDRRGIYNVAADGVLYLSQAVRVLGRVALPVILPLIAPVAGALRRFGYVDFATDQLQYLLYGRVADNARLAERFGYRPRRTTRDTLVDFAERRRLPRVISPERVEAWERDVYDFLRRRGGERFETARRAGDGGRG
jgi:UDP-glucose 4-epimerase